jgi:hypothetical protein
MEKMGLFIALNILVSIIYLFFPNNEFNGIKLRNNNNIIERWFERFYFSIVTSTTLGYGDVSPRTNIIKAIVIVQVLITFAIVLI